MLSGWPFVWAGALLILAGLASFVAQIRQTVGRRMPRPPALPSRDWSTWQTHAAFLWLLVAATLGITLSTGVGTGHRLTLMWIYGVAGLMGFLAQIVTGMQGRLVPLYAWYRALAAKGSPPERGANSLPHASFAKAVFLLWTAGLPLLAVGLPLENHLAIRLAALLLLGGVALGAAYILYMLRQSRRP